MLPLAEHVGRARPDVIDVSVNTFVIVRVHGRRRGCEEEKGVMACFPLGVVAREEHRSTKIEPDLEAAADGTRPRGQRGQRGEHGQRCGRWPTAASLELTVCGLRPPTYRHSRLSLHLNPNFAVSVFLSFYLK